MHVGLDFGTSNTAIAQGELGGEIRFLSFELLGARTHSYRSLLFFDPEEQEPNEALEYHAGAQAIEAYLEAMGEGRLIQSFKTHLTNTGLGRTQIAQHKLGLDEMLVLFFRRLRGHVQKRWGQMPSDVTIGRPVNFAGADEPAQNDLAQRRLREAAIASGFSKVQFALEPIAAAHHYERGLNQEELALIADFGGGTTDFCVMKLGPSRLGQVRDQDIVCTGGVGVAGDNLDAAIIDAVVAPQLGKGSMYEEMGKRAPIPASYYHKLSRWHQLSFLRSERTRSELERLQKAALNPQAIAALVHLIEHNQGFHLHKSVERLKIALSQETSAQFSFHDDPINIQSTVTRADFETWIASSVLAITQTLDQTLEEAGLVAKDIDRVFMTGGTAFVPCVRAAFAQRFGETKLRGGDEMMSIASGLSLLKRG